MEERPETERREAQLRAGAAAGTNGGPGIQQRLPTREDMLHTKFGNHVRTIKELGRKMAQEFDGLAETKAELARQGITFEIDLPQHVLTAMSVYQREIEREAASRERSGDGRRAA